MNEALSLIGDVGFPIAIALIAGFFIFLTIKYILESVIGQVNGIHGIVQALDNRVKTMNHDIVRLERVRLSNSFRCRAALYDLFYMELYNQQHQGEAG